MIEEQRNASIFVLRSYCFVFLPFPLPCEYDQELSTTNAPRLHVIQRSGYSTLSPQCLASSLSLFIGA